MEARMIFKNILVPTDLSEKSEKALDIAISMASRDKGTVTFLHVIEMIEGVEEEEVRDFYKKLKDRAQRGMDKIANHHTKSAVRIDKVIAIGKRVPEIIRLAQERDIDLIILSSHKIEEIRAGEGWATISYKVAILSPCPVLMVK
jgi:nucleotide-binding universal stress UspA family protein